MSGQYVDDQGRNVSSSYSYDANGLRTSKTVTIDYSHVHSYTSTVVAPTCTEEGYTLHECVCGDSYQDTVTPARGHFFATNVCTRCGASNHEHTYVETVVAPTCTADGYTLHECECGDSYKDTPTAATGHFYASDTAAICTRCGYNRAEEETLSLAEVTDSATVQEYSYVYNGSSLTQMTVITTPSGGTSTKATLYFAYANGQPMTVTYNGTTYYYSTNLQGDVTAILNSSGTAVVQYTYDAWGNILTTTGSMASTLGALNPLRYRGYVYDAETGLYYLQSRYYDPEMGRFINADSLVSTGQGILGNNMFTYCGNNPVIRIDADGAAFETIWDVISLGLSIFDVFSNPGDMWAWVGLAGDVADVLIPGVGGIGEAVKAAGTVGKIADGFGDLSQASKYGIKAYNELKELLYKTGLQAHHIIEQRLVKHLGIDVKTMLSVAVTAEEHQKFTNRWREIFKYGMDYTELTVNDLWDAAQKVYEGYPEILEAAEKILFG